ncbi:hypothetical protein ANN_22241 [Periplaneta americana]|uniref:Uncharacterized protein n=1 Tax=Periplaneta americana TaxID=6978 RepID=A0ABQ8S7L0_PERAM|nr:hypothetical protein ANN_22241 [Periplaneta americana]
MAGLCEGGNEQSGSLKAICNHVSSFRVHKHFGAASHGHVWCYVSRSDIMMSGNALFSPRMEYLSLCAGFIVTEIYGVAGIQSAVSTRLSCAGEHALARGLRMLLMRTVL